MSEPVTDEVLALKAEVESLKKQLMSQASSTAEPEIRSGFWYEEEQLPTYITKCGLNKILYEGKSPFQTISIVETNPFGLTLLLDGKTQSSALDEVVYHECLVHPAMLLHPNPQSVFIGGGGECATAREVLKHKSVKECIMVDIDEEVVRVSLKEMPTWADGCFEDARLKVYYEDAYAYIENYPGKFDVIIMDIADPIEAGPGIKLYTKEFYEMAITRLNPGGMIVSQSGVGSILNHTECFTVIHQTMKTVFDNVVIYTADTPSFGFNWGFNLAFNNDAKVASEALEKGKPAQEHILDLPMDEMNQAIQTRLSKPLKFLDAMSFRGVLGVPLPVRNGVANEKRVITHDNPVYMY